MAICVPLGKAIALMEGSSWNFSKKALPLYHNRDFVVASCDSNAPLLFHQMVHLEQF